VRPSQIAPPEGWREQIAYEDGMLSIARHLPCWTGGLLPEWGGLQGKFFMSFPKQQPVAIEYCSGNGTWIAAQAKAHPEINWVAVERRFDRVRQICSKRKNEGLPNLAVVWGEAEIFSAHFLTDASIDAVFINFPDPWPKKKHAHKRIMRPDFIEDLQRILKTSGILTFVTDDPDFASSTREIMRVEAGLGNLYPELGYANELPDYGNSTFEALWRSKGKQIFYHRYARLRQQEVSHAS
jgi:tRNA (guanine-N7-)-methyltransferase